METERGQASIRDVLRVLQDADSAVFNDLPNLRMAWSGDERFDLSEKVVSDTYTALAQQCQDSYGIRFMPFPEGYTLLQLQHSAATLYDGDFCGVCGYPSTPDVLVAPCSTCGEYLCDDCVMTHYHAEDGVEDEEK